MQEAINAAVFMIYPIIRSVLLTLDRLYSVLFPRSEVSGVFLPRSNKIMDRKHRFVLDTSAMLARSSFEIKPERLIERAKEVVAFNFGIRRPSDLADGFVFQFPVIRLNKVDYLNAVRNFRMEEVFGPGHTDGLYYDFRVDPYENNRVWFTAG